MESHKKGVRTGLSDIYRFENTGTSINLTATSAALYVVAYSSDWSLLSASSPGVYTSSLKIGPAIHPQSCQTAVLI
jgi:hypothetical protein